MDYLAAPLKESHRELDLNSGIAMSRHTLADGTIITQTILASAPHDVIVLRISATKPIDLRVVLQGGAVDNGDLVKTGAATGENATKYEGRVRVVADGEIAQRDQGLDIGDSQDVTIYISAATNYR